MKWIEIINLRSAGTGRKLIGHKVFKSISGEDLERNQVEFQIYHHVSVNTDLSIHLLHESDRADIMESPLALHLASALREFGLINHSI